MNSFEQDFDESSLSGNSKLSEHIGFINTRGTPVNEEQLEVTLRMNPYSGNVKSLRIKSKSHLKTLIAATALPKLQEICIESEHLRDYQILAALKGLRRLSIGVKRRKAPIPDLSHSQIEQLGISTAIEEEPATIGRIKSLRRMVVQAWPAHNLEALGNLALISLEVKANRILESGKLDCRNLEYISFRGCSQLRSVRGIEAKKLFVDTCRKLDLKTISGRWITELSLENMKRIESLGFFGNCPNLRKFEVAATRISSQCIWEIAAAKQLTFAGLYGCALPVRELRVLSTLSPQLIVTDGMKSYRAGQEIPT